MILKHLSSILILFSSLNLSYSQNETLFNGQLLDKSTKKPVPYAHIINPATGKGVISNQQGIFKLYLHGKDQPSTLKISCIGYKSKIVNIPSNQVGNRQKIYLKKDTKILHSVNVYPDITAKDIVKKAIEHINVNYPTQEERIKGFIRESSYSDSSYYKPYYIAEASIEAHKKGYQHVTKKGHVKRLKGRKYIGENYSDLMVRFAGTPHIPHWGDFVNRRRGPLNKQNLNEYIFNIIDTTRYENIDVIKINFIPKGNVKGRGHLLIALDTYTIVKLKYKLNNEEINTLSDKLLQVINKYTQIYSRYIVEYSKYDKHWRLKYINHQSVFQNKKNNKRTTVNSIFSVTGYHPTNEKIPYNERLQKRDILLEKTGKYDRSFWEGFNTLSYDTTLKNSNNNKQPDWNNEPQRSLTDIKLEIVSGIRSDIGIYYFNTPIPGWNINYGNAGLNINETVKHQSTNHNLGWASTFAYELTDQFIIGIESKSSIASKKYTGDWLFFNWEHNLRPKKRPLYLITGIQTGYEKKRHKLGNYQSDGAFKIDGKAFDSNSTEVFVESRAFSINPSISISLEQNHRFRYYAQLNYNFRFGDKNGLYFRENDGFFLFRKNEFLENNNDNNLFYPNTTLFTKNNFTFELGITLTFYEIAEK